MFANKSKFKGPEGTTGLKKKAPPRPPPPSNSQLTRSITIHGVSTIQDSKYSNSKGVQRQQSTTTCSYNIANRADLIDLSSPTNSPPKSNAGIMSGLDKIAVPDFKYHIGASIFYVKSELKNTNKSTQQVNPFSPPRPSPQSLLSSTNAGTTSHKSRAPVPKKLTSNPTIIKSSAQRTDSVGNSGSRNQPSIIPAQTQYTVPLEWDEPPKKTYAPTVIRPIPPPKKPGLGASRVKNDAFPPAKNNNGQTRNSLPYMVSGVAEVLDSRPIYDEPPGGSEDDDDDDEFDSKPMPSMPPPPPPIVFEPFVDNTNVCDDNIATAYDYSNEHQQGVTTWTDGNRPYGIALYDYVSGEPGDLQFLAGDVIYLKYAVDDSWLCGTCGAEEGIFPSNFLNIVVPLPDNIIEAQSSTPPVYEDSQNVSSRPVSYSNEDYSASGNNAHYVQVLHDFEASEFNDLTIREGDVVTVLGKINDEWLYGELYGMKGQFPASFLSFVPSDLNIISPDSLNG